jgi:hypothetical protein
LDLDAFCLLGSVRFPLFFLGPVGFLALCSFGFATLIPTLPLQTTFPIWLAGDPVAPYFDILWLAVWLLVLCAVALCVPSRNSCALLPLFGLLATVSTKSICIGIVRVGIDSWLHL